jgi:hypothetical protein
MTSRLLALESRMDGRLNFALVGAISDHGLLCISYTNKLKGTCFKEINRSTNRSQRTVLLQVADRGYSGIVEWLAKLALEGNDKSHLNIVA